MRVKDMMVRVLLLSMLLLFISSDCLGQKRDSAPKTNPELRFLGKRIIDYGHIKSNDEINIEVLFENAGLNPLCILNVITTCNCTTAQTDKRIYEHKERGKIKVRIEAKGKSGSQTTVIRLFTNADRQQSIVRIDYFVEN